MRWLSEVWPGGVVLTLLLAAGWVAMWWSSRRARLWYAVLAPLAACCSLPVGVLAGRLGTALVCPAGHPECSGGLAVAIWANGAVALPVAVVLGLLTGLVEAGRYLARPTRRRG